MSGFANPIIGGGGALVYPAIHSPNFMHGISGWSIRKDGTAEFQALILPAGGPAVVTFAAAAPPTPNTGDLWYDTSSGLLAHQWNGAAWVPYQIGTGAIAAGTITAALIAANTITAAQIAAGTITATEIAAAAITTAKLAAGAVTAAKLAVGIVYAGIVDATTITGAVINAGTFNGTNYIERDNGAWWYSGTPAAGNLIASITDASRTDAFGNKTPAGGGFCTYNTTTGVACQYAKNGITFYTGSLGGDWVVAANSVLSFDGTNVILNAAGSVTIGGILEADQLFVATSQPLTVGSLAAPAGAASQLEVKGAIGVQQRAAPGTPPAGYGYLYVNSSTGALHYKGPSGTDTSIAPA